MSTDKKTSLIALLRSSFTVAGATFASRVLGLVRVRLEALVLGGGEFASGWFLAFAIPNLLRRILGEGALGSALIPIISRLDVNEGRERVKKELGTLFFVLGMLLAVIVIFVSAISLVLAKVEYFQNISFFSTPRMRFVLELLPLLMPYGLFMCLVGVAGSVLNHCKVFFLPALGALLLNIFLVSGLGTACFLQVKDVEKIINILAYLVLLSGFVQLVLMFLLLRKNHCFPAFKASFSWTSFKNETVKEIFSLALPGMIGGIATQVSFLIDRMLAVSLGAQAVPALTYIDRLIDLPIGIFAVSLGTVLMSSMSNSAAAGDTEDFSKKLEFSIRQVFFFCIPMAVGIIFFYNLLMSVLCLGGRYTVQDLYAAQNVALCYGCGIPVFCLLKALVPAFNSRKKMMPPFYASLCAIFLNIILNLILMHPFKQAGIAFATFIASVVNCSILLFLLIKEKVLLSVWSPVKSLLRSLLFSILSAAIVNEIMPQSRYIVTCWNKAVLYLGLSGTLFVVLYFGLSAVMRAPESGELLDVFRRRKL